MGGEYRQSNFLLHAEEQSCEVFHNKPPREQQLFSSRTATLSPHLHLHSLSGYKSVHEAWPEIGTAVPDKATPSLRPNRPSQCCFQLSEKSLLECHEAKRKQRQKMNHSQDGLGLCPYSTNKHFLPTMMGRVLHLHVAVRELKLNGLLSPNLQFICQCTRD